MQKYWQLAKDFSFSLLEKKRWLYALIGPLFLLSSFAILATLQWPLLLPYFFALLITLLSILIWKKKALLLSLAPLVLLASLNYLQYRSSALLFALLSSLLGLWIFHLTLEEFFDLELNFSQKIKKENEEAKKIQEKCQALEIESQKSNQELLDLQESIDSLKRLVQKEKDQVELLLKEKQNLAEDFIAIKKQNHELNSKWRMAHENANEGKINQQLLKELNDLRTNYFQLKQFSKKDQLKSERKGLQNKYEELQKEYFNLKNLLTKSNSTEVDEKLQEKMEELHEVRIDLFKVESKLMSVSKENERLSIETPLQEKALSDYLQITDNECLRLEQENELLQQLISSWLDPQSTK